MALHMTTASMIADQLLDYNSDTFQAIDFHNVAAVSEVIVKLTSSKDPALNRKAELLHTALNFYHIGRGNLPTR